MATNVKILLRRGLRNELAGADLDGGELGFTTDTNQLYVGLEKPAVNEIQFDPFANAHAVIQSWLDSADCTSIQSGLTVDEDLVVADIDPGKIDSIISALNTYTQTLVFDNQGTPPATFTVGELLTQYVQKRTILTSPNVIPDEEGIATNFTLEGESISVGGNTITAGSFVIGTKYKIVTAGTTDYTLIGAANNNVDTIFKATGVGAGTGTATDTVTLQSLLTTLQANAALKTANVISQVEGSGAASKLKFCKIDGEELNLVFATSPAGNEDAEAIGFTQNIFSVTGGSFITGTEYTITALGDDTLTIITSGAFIVGQEYKIKTVGTTDFTTIGAADNNIGTVFTATVPGTGNGTANTFDTFSAGSFYTGDEYRILVPGTTDFTLIGAADSNVGTVFTATSCGTGTGTANSTSEQITTSIQQHWEAAGAPAPTTAGSFVAGKQYKILSTGWLPNDVTLFETDFTKFGSADNDIGTIFTATATGTVEGDGTEQYTAGNFVVGRVYTISDLGDTDFTLIGASSNTIGHTFTATGVGAGTGDAYFTGTGTATSVIVGSTFTADDVGTGNGTATWDNGVNTVAKVTGYDVYANGTITESLYGSGITTVTVEVNEYSEYFAYLQEGDTSTYPYVNAPDTSAYFYFGTPSTPDYSALSPAVDTTSVTDAPDTKIGLFGSKRKNVEVLTEESRNQLFTNQHLKSYSAADGLRSDLYKKKLGLTPVTAGAFVIGTEYKILTVGTTDFTLIGSADSNVGTVFTATGVGTGNGTAGYGAGTFLSYDADEATTFFIDYSLKQVGPGPTAGSTITFVRTGTLRMINGVPQEIDLAKLTDTNVEVHQDNANFGVVDANEMSNIVFTAVIDGTSPNQNIKVNYTQDINFTSEISYTVKRWTM